MHLRQARRILLCLRYGIGDVVMETRAIEALRLANPGAHLTLLGASPAVELFRDFPGIDRLERVGRWGLRHWGDGGTAEMRRTFARWLEEEQFDLILDPSHAVFAVREVLWQGGWSLLDASDADQEQALRLGLRSSSAVNEAVRRGWGLQVRAPETWKMPVPEGRRRWAQGFLGRLGTVFHHPLAISTVASSHLKRWPPERLAHVADRLADEAQCGILLFCGQQRREAQEVAAALPRRDRVVLVGPVHLQRVAALLQRCRLFVGNDTGLMHLAAAVGTPVVAVFGPTSPGVYLPDTPAAAGLQGPTACPCRRRQSFGPPACLVQDRCLQPGRGGCIEEVEIAEVLARSRQLLIQGREDAQPGT